MTNEMDNRLAQGRAVIQGTHDAIWRDWLSSTPGVSRATLRLIYECASSGYRPEQNELLLNLPEANVEDAADEGAHDQTPPLLAGIGWPAWKRELVHELLHEYQHKVVAGNASVVGKALEQKYRHCFDGPGHDAHFFTAIAEKASYFGMSPETLIMNL